MHGLLALGAAALVVVAFCRRARAEREPVRPGAAVLDLTAYRNQLRRRWAPAKEKP